MDLNSRAKQSSPDNKRKMVYNITFYFCNSMVQNGG